MNRVSKRTWLMSLFILVLMLGMVFFLGEYLLSAKKWVSFTGSPHLYRGENLGTGQVYDRSGILLLDTENGRSYAENVNTRTSSLHWLGDRQGNIRASAVSSHAAEMVGYNPITGVYNPAGEGGKATLSISAKVQNVALEAMAGRKGTVAVYNYKTGEILCAVTTPSYDPDNVPNIAEDSDGKYSGVYLNRFVQSTYVPGSIFKIVTTAAALDCVDGIEEMTFTCNGIRHYGTEAVTCERAHGTQTLKQAFANSCNCAYSYVAELIGKDKMTSYVKKFAVTDSVQFDGVTTQKGNYNNHNTAPVSFAWSCIGQYTDLINPAGFLRFMGAIAGDGVGVEPYLVSEIHCGEDTTYRAKTVKTNRVVSKDVAKTMQEYMRNNVNVVYGAGHFPGLSVCAKSGTSQLGGGQKSNAMFSGFITDEAYPLAFIVVVENGGYGSHTCVPVLSKVLAACKQVLDNA